MDKVTVEELDVFVAEVFEQRKKCDEMSGLLTEENKKLAAMEQKVTGFLKELGRKEYKCPAGSMTITEKWRVNLPSGPENRELFFQYLKDKGIFDDLISVNSNTLNAYYRTEFAIAKSEGNFEFSIPGLDEPKLYESVTMRKTK